jgi:hypothetical protein
MSIILIIYVTLVHFIKTIVNHPKDIKIYTNVKYIVRMIEIVIYKMG